MEKMKKLILISIVASSVLFASNVDELKIVQENEVERTEMNSAKVSQGETILVDADIDNLKIKEKKDGNAIKDTLINTDGAVDVTDPGFDETPYNHHKRDTVITQGRTIVIDGEVKDAKINSDSTIDDSTITAFGHDSLAIDQGFTLVEGAGQELKDAKIKSDNTISDVEIEGGGQGGTKIKQANFLMLDEGGASEATDIKINTRNLITGGTIGQADIKQAVTELTDGAVAKKLDVEQHNIIRGNTEIQNYSEISQGVTSVDNATISKLDQKVTNVIADVEGSSSAAVDSKIKQADINVKSGSDVALVYEDHTNVIRDVQVEDSTLKQDTLLAKNDSYIRDFKQKADNSVIDVRAVDSKISQNSLRMSDATLDGSPSVSLQKNVIKDSHLLNSRLAQASISIKESMVTDLVVSEKNRVHDSSFRNAVLTQGRLVIR